MGNPKALKDVKNFREGSCSHSRVVAVRSQCFCRVKKKRVSYIGTEKKEMDLLGRGPLGQRPEDLSDADDQTSGNGGKRGVI